MELKKRSFLILALFYVDLTLHGSIIFGWNSLSQIYKLEVPELSKETRKIFTILCGQSSFDDEKYQSSLVFIISMSLIGVVTFVFGSIRDFAAYGLARIAVYSSLTLSYILLAFAPNHPRLQF